MNVKNAKIYAKTRNEELIQKWLNKYHPNEDYYVDPWLGVVEIGNELIMCPIYNKKPKHEAVGYF